MSGPENVHSPLPWLVNGRGSTGYRIDAPSAERTGLAFLQHPVAIVPALADADRIVHAVNHHDPLVAALREVLQAGTATATLDRLRVLLAEIESAER